jgi:hypothetical protein
MQTDFRSLFGGAARFGLLAGSQERPWAMTTPVFQAFPEELNRYLELSIDTDNGDIGLMTRGEGKDFCHRFAKLLEQQSHSEEELRRFLVRARYFEHLNLFVKFELDPQGISELSYYFRRRPALDAAHAWLADSGADEDARKGLDEVAQILKANTVQFMASSIGRDGSRADKAYFSMPREPQAWTRVGRAAVATGTPLSTWNAVDLHREAFIGHTLFLTLGWKQGVPTAGCKLYVHAAPAPAVQAVMKNAGASEESMGRADLLCSLHEQEAHDYVGFDLRPDSPIRTKVYAYRRGP